MSLEPVGRQLARVSGTYGAGFPLQLSRKKFAYVGPVGNTGLLGRARAFQPGVKPYDAAASAATSCREPVGRHSVSGKFIAI